MADYRINGTVVTYDPSYIDQHFDSTDFDDHCPTKQNKRYRKRGKPLVKRTKAEREFSMTCLKGHYPNVEGQSISKNPTVDATTSFCHHCGNSVLTHPEPISSTQPDKKNMDTRGTSKVNLLRKKISSIFFRSNNRRAMAPIEENNMDDIHNYKVYCADCRRRQLRKYTRRRHQGFPPVYLVDDVTGGPMRRRDAPEHYRLLSRDTYPRSSTLSSTSEIEICRDQLYRQRKDDALEKEFKNEFLKFKKEKEKQLNTRSQQYSKYQVFANQYSQAENDGPPRVESATAFGNGVPVTASGLWEFFINKFNARYQEAKSLTSNLRCCPPHCGNSALVSEMKKSKGQQISESQTQPQSQPRQFQASSSQRSKNNYNDISSSDPSPSRPFMSPDKSYTPISTAKSNARSDAACNCNPNEISQAQRGKTPKSTQAVPSDSKSCQEPHDDITRMLKEKYNAEVLCIHNPPCVLINGCLNMPQQMKPASLNVWPVVTAPEKKSGYLRCRRQKKANKKSSDQACQYHPSYGMLREYRVNRAEKLMQSVCNHCPPCLVVPGCFKPKYDPGLVNSCVHVPMCKKTPECLVGHQNSSLTCDHTPRCFDVPECRKNYAALTRGDVCTQLPLVCTHQPPCIMIPRCLGRVMSDVIPSEAIPDCTHRPPCDLIPACCRNSAKDAFATIRPPFNKGVYIKIPQDTQSKLMKMVTACRNEKRAKSQKQSCTE